MLKKSEIRSALGFQPLLPYSNMIAGAALATLVTLGLFVASTFWPVLALCIVVFSGLSTLSRIGGPKTLSAFFSLAILFFALANPYVFAKLALMVTIFSFFLVFGEDWKKAGEKYEEPAFGELVMCGIMMVLMSATGNMITLGAANYWHDNFDERTPLYRLEHLPDYLVKMPPTGSYSFGKSDK